MKKTTLFFYKMGISLLMILTSMALQPLAHAGVATTIGTGSYHSCATISTGGAKCWGSGSFGQLGDGIKSNRSTPVTVQGLSKYTITSIAGGTYYTCALTSTGQVFCWGDNSVGQLGNGSYVSSSTPVAVLLQTGPAKAISVGNSHACLLDSFGNVYCWGQNRFNELNRQSTLSASNYPVYAAGDSDIVAIAGTGMTTCIVDKNGGNKCFGLNSYGQFGIGTTAVTVGTPTYSTGLSTGIVATGSGINVSCTLSSVGVVSCFGRDPYGLLGFVDQGIRNYPSPVKIVGLRSDTKSIAVGGSHVCTTTLTGKAQCWGYNAYGQAGRGTITNASLPADVAPLSEFITQIVTGGNHTCALTSTGTVKCWGANSMGQLGTGTTNNSTVAVDVIGL